MSRRRPCIFVGSSSESLPVATALQRQLQADASVKVWNQGVFGIAQYTFDELVRATAKFDFAIFVVAADDTIESRGERYLVARDNVLLELGMFAGGHHHAPVSRQLRPDRNPLRQHRRCDGARR